jgi:hypothetical protein
MKKGGNISIKLTNILKQTQECCNKKKCPKNVKRCKPSKKKRKKKDDDEGLFGGMPNIRPTSRAIPMPQSVMNNITPVPNIPIGTQLPVYSQFRTPHGMYQRNDRPLQVQQGRGVRQSRLLKSKSSSTQTTPTLTLTRGVIQDRERRGMIGTADQPFNPPVPPPNILDKDAILMRNAEADRRAISARVRQMERRIEETLKDIQLGTPRSVREADEVIHERLIKNVNEEILNREGLNNDENREGIEDAPRPVRRGRPTTQEHLEATRRRVILSQLGDTTKYKIGQVLAMTPSRFEEAGAGAGSGGAGAEQEEQKQDDTPPAAERYQQQADDTPPAPNPAGFRRFFFV